MTGGIYDHLLIISTFCSFIQGMTNALLLHNLLIQTLWEILQKSSRKKLRVRGNPRKGVISVRTGIYASRDAGFCVPEITDTYWPPLLAVLVNEKFKSQNALDILFMG